LSVLLVVAVTLAESESHAHHSASIYNRQAPVSIEGVVVRREWRNPHVYLYVEQETGGERVVWEVEGLAPFVLKRLGWTEETVRVGDRVTVTGIAGRNQDRKIALMETLAKPGDPVLQTTMGRAIGVLTRPGPPVAEPANGLAGQWVAVLGPDAIKLMMRTPDLQLTEKGKAALEGFSADEIASRCGPTPPPLFMMIPDVKSIELRRRTVLIRGGEADAGERVVHLDADSHDGAAPSAHGHSIGRWEGRTLVIDTTHFTPFGPGGTTARVPSGSAKHLVEWLELDENGFGLTYRFELDDPEFLAVPLAGAVQWTYRPDLTYEAAPCDAENARRFLE
jgi:hypothetical protein